jgi:CO/xanthine dehydrogenase FAD-binding subunit
MKAANFEYSRPASVKEACGLLASDEDARIIAGGQTLVPMMAMRLARPTRLVDISRIPDLSFIRDDGDAIIVGAATRQAIVEHSAVIARKLPLLALALPWVGHTATRNRGTVGGSIANADPAAEIPLVLMTLGGAIVARSVEHSTTIAADDLFDGPMSTAIPAASCLVEARFPVWKHARIGVAFFEISARQSDFAYVAAAAQVALDDAGRCVACAIGIGGATSTPTRLDGAGAALMGTAITEDNVRSAIAAEIAALDIMIDPHASPAYRRRVAATFALRAVLAAHDDATRSGARA